MKPLLILLITFGIAIIITSISGAGNGIALAGRIAMAVMLFFTAIAHFKVTKGMAMMLPPFVPYKKGMVLSTGIVEFAAAAGLLIPSLQITTAWLLILFFIFILPANIYAATRKVDYEKGTYNGKGVNYLWFRVPLQLLFIIWTYYFAIYRPGS
ncbi:MAG: hypothetical protein QM640_07500 [Niabella sp.]